MSDTTRSGYDTPDVIKQIKEIWEPGMSSRDIAAEMTARFKAMTRNAVIGMFQRHEKELFPCRLGGTCRPLRTRNFPAVQKDGSSVAKKIKPAPTVDPKAGKKHFTKRGAHDPAPHTSPVPLPQDPPAPPTAKNIDLEHLTEKTCRWPLNTGHPFIFCGVEPYPDKPYCTYHCRLAYTPPRPPKKRNRDGQLI